MAGLTGEASFTYEGETYRLTLNNRAFYRAEQALGYSSLAAAEQLKADIDAGRYPMLQHIVAFFYGALIQNHPAVSEDDAIDMVMSADQSILDALRSVLTGSDMPEAGNGAAAAGTTRTAKSGTGKGSSKAGGKRASGRKSSG